MNETPTTKTVCLHIGGNEKTPPGIDPRTMGDSCIDCPDVYRGLALTLQPGSQVRSVLVNAGALLPEEFEFFQILPSQRGDLRIEVYGDAAACSRAVELIRASAHRASANAPYAFWVPVVEKRNVGEPANLAPIRHDEAEHSTPTQEPPPEDGPPAATVDTCPSPSVSSEAGYQDSSEPIEAHGPSKADAPATEPVASPNGDTDDQPLAARVPWKRYEDRPMRIAPARTELSPGPVAAEPPSASEKSNGFAHEVDRHAPLLTPEEIDALMYDEDDLTSLANDERDQLLADHPAQDSP